MQPFVVEPVNVRRGGQLNVSQGLPGSFLLDQLGPVQADRRFHQGVIQRVSDGADGGVDPGLDQVPGEHEAGVLRSGIVAGTDLDRADAIGHARASRTHYPDRDR